MLKENKKLGDVIVSDIGTDLGQYIFTANNNIYIRDDLPFIKTRADFVWSYKMEITTTNDNLWEMIHEIVTLSDIDIYILSGTKQELLKIKDLDIRSEKNIRINGSYDLKPVSLYAWHGNSLRKIYEF